MKQDFFYFFRDIQILFFGKATTRAPETLKNMLNNQTDFFLSLSIKLIGHWLLAKTNFEAINSVFNIIDENKSFSLCTPNYWAPTGCTQKEQGGKETINNLKEIIELRSQNDIELHVKEVETKSW